MHWAQHPTLCHCPPHCPSQAAVIRGGSQPRPPKCQRAPQLSAAPEAAKLKPAPHSYLHPKATFFQDRRAWGAGELDKLPLLPPSHPPSPGQGAGRDERGVRAAPSAGQWRGGGGFRPRWPLTPAGTHTCTQDQPPLCPAFPASGEVSGSLGRLTGPEMDPRAEGAGAGGSGHMGETPGAPEAVRTTWLRVRISTRTGLIRPGLSCRLSWGRTGTGTGTGSSLTSAGNERCQRGKSRAG